MALHVGGRPAVGPAGRAGRGRCPRSFLPHCLRLSRPNPYEGRVPECRRASPLLSALNAEGRLQGRPDSLIRMAPRRRLELGMLPRLHERQAPAEARPSWRSCRHGSYLNDGLGQRRAIHHKRIAHFCRPSPPWSNFVGGAKSGVSRALRSCDEKCWSRGIESVTAYWLWAGGVR